MKTAGIVLLFTFVLSLTGCGGMGTGGMSGANSNVTNNMDGNWTATMTTPSGVQMMVFTTALSQNSGNVVTATSFQFKTAAPCFATGTSGTGAVMPNPNMNGSTVSSFGMTIQSGDMEMQAGSMDMQMGMTGNNVLTLQGSMSNMNTISGTWTMSGVTSGCSGSGNFTMTRM